ncbi:MAG TPA: glycosyltransferase family 39 protein [Gemmatimonadales bacterium]|nr:glycosyltransferase family 39 protein [Gemmatimonadales bacterium]
MTEPLAERPAAPSLTGAIGARGWTLFAMAGAALDLSLHLFRNWVAFDEGALGLASRLVREGRWPHAGYSDVYSGGLALLGAGAQWAFGDDLVSLRIPLGIATVLWVGVLAACFRRFVSPAAAAALAFLGYLWGPPLYTAAMPSWYLLFLATALCWTLLRWHETDDARWWGAAGLCIGLAVFIKINALFLLAGAGCILLTDERHRGGLVAALPVILAVVGAWLTVSRGWPWVQALTLVLPLALLALAAVKHEARARGGAPTAFGPIVRPLGWLLLGVAAVIVPWVVAYAVHGGLPELAQGLFVLPFKRSHAARLIPPPYQLRDLLPIALLPALLLGRWDRRWAIGMAVAMVGLTLYLIGLANVVPVATVRAVWRVARGWAVLAPILVAVVALHRWERPLRPALIAGWIAAWFALLQYPFGAPNYLAYSAALLLLAGTAAASFTAVRPVGAAVALALGLWTVAVDHSQSLSELGFTHRSPEPVLAPLDVAHGGGLLIPPSHAEIMRGVVAVLDQWGARTIVAGPDAPEIYYFSGRDLPDRELFEFTAPGWSAAELARRIALHDPDAAVLNAWAPFSGVALDSVTALLPRPPVADTVIGPFHLLLFRRPAPK